MDTNMSMLVTYLKVFLNQGKDDIHGDECPSAANPCTAVNADRTGAVHQVHKANILWK